MRCYGIVSEICDGMRELGWGPYQNDHEDANGQFEINWGYADALLTADRHLFFKYMVKSIAEKHGMRATFMPKPFEILTGNGCHVHASLWTSESSPRNLFTDPAGELGLSPLAYNFLGGILHLAPAICALTNPTVNSYKRINAPATRSGATWSPNAVTWSGNNRTHMVRVPEGDRFELRLADGAVNPYLLQAAVLAAGLDGLRNKRDPGQRLDINMYTQGHTVKNVTRLPLNLLDATREFEKSATLAAAFGDGFMRAYGDHKRGEWERYSNHLSTWERQHTLDC